METPTRAPINFLNKITLILFGLFLTALIFALLIRAFQEIGIWLGLILNIILVFCGFYYIEKGTRLRLITWGILGTLIFGTIFFIVGLQILTNLLSDL